MSPSSSPSPVDPSPYASPSSPGVQTSRKAIWSLMCGVCSLFCCFVVGIPGLILGIGGMNEVKQSEGRLTGHGLALAGAILSGAGLVMTGFATLGILIALLLPAVQAGREAAGRSQCKNNLAQLSVALHNYHNVYGSFPPAFVLDEQGQPMHSWRALILPHLDVQGELPAPYDFNEPWNGPHNSGLALAVPKVFRCPSGADTLPPGHTGYLAVVGDVGMWPRTKPRSRGSVRDGLGNTIMLVEAQHNSVNWLEPTDLDAETLPIAINGPEPDGVSSSHLGGANFLLGDGSVRFYANTISPGFLQAIFTANGGEQVTVDPSR